jgi:hypothetical protein
MILPITPLFNRSGLPGGGVPAFTVDPSTGDVIGQVGHLIDWTDPTSGEGDGVTGDRGGAVTIDENGDLVEVPILNTGALRSTHGRTVWGSSGSYKDESDFDLWRRAGKPALCGGGMGDTGQDVLNAIAAGTAAAAGYPLYPYPGQYPGGYQPQPQVAVAGSASAGAWILGGIGLAVALFAISKR